MNIKKLILTNLPYLLFVYPFDKLAQAFRLAPGADLSAKLLSIRDGFSMAFASPAPSLEPADLLIGIAGALILRLAVYMKGKNAKKYRHGMEYGSARWGTPADIAPYMDKDFFNNIPMTQTERITMSSRPKQPKYARNKNILVIGGSGSGKTRFFCKPSLLQAHSSYVCTDPKGTLLPEIGSFLETDELELDTLGDSKTALFVIISNTDSTFNFVAALMYSQLFNLLCDKADDFYGGRLPVHVRLILDEFANIGQIPNFDKLIATIRSREISASIILQSQIQFKTIYKDAADTIVGNCDSTLFLGGKEKSTLKEISELLGKETIDSYNQSENRGAQTSHGLTYQKLGKELMTQDELAVMDGGKCIFMLRGVRPFLSEKHDLTKHPNYRYTADADPKNVFDMERYMKKQRAVVKPADSFDVYEIDVTE